MHASILDIEGNSEKSETPVKSAVIAIYDTHEEAEKSDQ